MAIVRTGYFETSDGQRVAISEPATVTGQICWDAVSITGASATEYGELTVE